MMALSSLPAIGAEGDTAWTNVDGTTIWARPAGWDGDRLILVMRGNVYRVPLDKLAARSVAKARALVGDPVALASRSKTERTSPGAAMMADHVSSGLPVVESASDLAAANLPPVSSPLGLDASPKATTPSPSEVSPLVSGDRIQLCGKIATAPALAPAAVLAAVAAGNRLQTKYYKWGGGRGRHEDSGYDCSGSVSFALIKAGLLSAPLTSGSFTRYGTAGKGRWITIYARHGHVFMTICGLRLDTGWHGGGSGPRWCANSRPTGGFVARHPAGY